MYDRSITNTPAAAMILAAGPATRMGTLKQLLPYGNGTLLTHAICQAQLAHFERTIVVVGAEAETVTASIKHLPVEIAVNDDWESGMGSSIFAGLQQLETSGQSPELLAILLADQPHITAAQLAAMRRAAEAVNTPILAASYNDILGVPAFFRSRVFPMLASLPPAAGARSLFRDGKLQVTAFPLPEAAIDVDTPGDFAALPVRT